MGCPQSRAAIAIGDSVRWCCVNKLLICWCFLEHSHVVSSPTPSQMLPDGQQSDNLSCCTQAAFWSRKAGSEGDLCRESEVFYGIDVEGTAFFNHPDDPLGSSPWNLWVKVTVAHILHLTMYACSVLQ